MLQANQAFGGTSLDFKPSVMGSLFRMGFEYAKPKTKSCSTQTRKYLVLRYIL
jgi:hypothetical protein